MSIFDLQAFARPGAVVLPPAGFQTGWVRINDLDETIFFSTAIWSRAEYVQHWRDAARRLANGADFAAFCTDLTPDNASLFAGFRSSDCVWFEAWIMLRSALTIDGSCIAPTRAIARSEEGNASSWQVSIDAVRTFSDH